jgi:hypothetical protein
MSGSGFVGPERGRLARVGGDPERVEHSFVSTSTNCAGVFTFYSGRAQVIALEGGTSNPAILSVNHADRRRRCKLVTSIYRSEIYP